MPARRFRIAFSFAGEKRAFVEQVAALLSARFGEPAILYDKYHEAEFARHDLRTHLPKLYREESDLIVPVLCPDYDPKRWVGWEWAHISGLLATADGRRVMPSRFAWGTALGPWKSAWKVVRATIAGRHRLRPAVGFIELDHKTPEQFAALILERLAFDEDWTRDDVCCAPAPPLRTSTPYTSTPNNPRASLAWASRLPLRTSTPYTSTPNNLPHLPPFFGRGAELARIRAALAPENRTRVVLIDGPGGVGKTSLAVRAAYDCPPGQFQRIVFVSVKDREPDGDGVRPPGAPILPEFPAVLNAIARELGQPVTAGPPEDQHVRLVLDALPAPVLLVLDNLESLPWLDHAQLLGFVWHLPPGCKAVVTGQRRFCLPGEEELTLAGLDPEAALEALDDLARRYPLFWETTREERIVLSEQVAGNPLLLLWVAEQFGRGRCRTLADALNLLRAGPKGNDPRDFIARDLAAEAETGGLGRLGGLTLPPTGRDGARGQGRGPPGGAG